VEKVYETALAVELAEQGIAFTQQAPLRVSYTNQLVGRYLADFVVDGTVILEIKAVEALADIHEAQVLSYPKATGLEVGLLINFGATKTETKRVVRQIQKSSAPSASSGNSAFP
jgi:GxxExxY protein